MWFFGLQLTLQTRPDEVRPLDDQGCRHFGVVLDDADTFWALVARLRDHGVEWISEPHEHEAAELSGKVGGKLADPAGNVIEIKYYADPTAFLADRGVATSRPDREEHERRGDDEEHGRLLHRGAPGQDRQRARPPQ